MYVLDFRIRFRHILWQSFNQHTLYEVRLAGRSLAFARGHLPRIVNPVRLSLLSQLPHGGINNITFIAKKTINRLPSAKALTLTLRKYVFTNINCLLGTINIRKGVLHMFLFLLSGGPGGTRTHDPKIKSLQLYLLSYGPAPLGAPYAGSAPTKLPRQPSKIRLPQDKGVLVLGLLALDALNAPFAFQATDRCRNLLEGNVTFLALLSTVAQTRSDLRISQRVLEALHEGSNLFRKLDGSLVHTRLAGSTLLLKHTRKDTTSLFVLDLSDSDLECLHLRHLLLGHFLPLFLRLQSRSLLPQPFVAAPYLYGRPSRVYLCKTLRFLLSLFLTYILYHIILFL